MHKVVTMNIPDDLKYTKEHEWARKEPDGIRIGITDHAQKELTDIVYVGLPKVGITVQKGKPICVVESIKTTSDVFAPVSGVVKKVNNDLEAHPEYINKDPYGTGWIALLDPSNPGELDSLLTPRQYREYLSTIKH